MATTDKCEGCVVRVLNIKPDHTYLKGLVDGARLNASWRSEHLCDLHNKMLDEVFDIDHEQTS